MGLSRKPKRQEAAEAAVQAVIGKGGTPAGAQGGIRKVLLRIPAEMLDRVDEAAAGRAVPTSRTTWLLEAVHEKLAGGAGDH